MPLNRAVHLDVRVVRVGLLGYGRIGQAVARLAGDEHERLIQAGIELRCVSALVRDLEKARCGPPIRLTTDRAGVLGRGVDAVVEVLGGVEPARTLVVAALRSGVPVITANKTLVATCGRELRALAERHQTTLAFDAAVLAGVPFLGSLSRRPLMASARRLEGVLNGTSHFITGAIEQGASFEDALAEAVSRGYAEPDSSADTSGRDAAEKLTILLHLAGCHDVRVADLPCTSLNVLEPDDFTSARRLGGTIKPVAVASLDSAGAGAWVGPAFVPERHAFARLEGVGNALQLTDIHGRHVVFAGPGAGPDATAVTIIDDIVEAVTAGFATAPAQTAMARGRVSPASLGQPAAGAWFLRVDRRLGDLAEFLAARRVPALQLVETERHRVALTATASWPAIREVVAAFEASGTHALALPVV